MILSEYMIKHLTKLFSFATRWCDRMNKEIYNDGYLFAMERLISGKNTPYFLRITYDQYNIGPRDFYKEGVLRAIEDFETSNQIINK